MTSTSEPTPRQQQFVRSTIGSDMSFLLARANAVSLSAANADLAEHGLRVRSYSVLALAVDDIRPSQKEIAEFLRLDPSQVVTLIDDLERDGLVERVPDPRDRRSKVLVATDAGRELHSRARTSLDAGERTLLELVPEADRSALADALRHLAFPTG